MAEFIASAAGAEMTYVAVLKVASSCMGSGTSPRIHLGSALMCEVQKLNALPEITKHGGNRF